MNRARLNRFEDQYCELMQEAEVVRAIDIIAEEAETFPIYDGETRRMLLPSYPYAVLFEVIGDVVFVIAVAHLKREPRYWKK